MTPKDILKRIEQKIELNSQDWCDAWLAKEAHVNQDTPEAKKQIGAAEHAMKVIADRIETLKGIKKKLAPKPKAK